MAALLQKAGDNNMGAALRDLALAHLQGNGVPQDVEKAISLLERVGHCCCCCSLLLLLLLVCLGAMCHQGTIRSPFQASAAGDADAQNYLGYFYWVGKEEGDANSNNSSSSSSSSSGSSKSSSGFVLKKDLAKAERFFTLAALQEHPEAFYFLGEIRLQQAADIKQETEKAKVLHLLLRFAVQCCCPSSFCLSFSVVVTCLCLSFYYCHWPLRCVSVFHLCTPPYIHDPYSLRLSPLGAGRPVSTVSVWNSFCLSRSRLCLVLSPRVSPRLFVPF